MFPLKRHGYLCVNYFDEVQNHRKRISTHATRKSEALRFLSEFDDKLKKAQEPQFISVHEFSGNCGEHIRHRYITNYFLTIKQSPGALNGLTGNIIFKGIDRKFLETLFDSDLERRRNTGSRRSLTLAAAFSKGPEWNCLSQILLKKITTRHFDSNSSDCECNISPRVERTCYPRRPNRMSKKNSCGIRIVCGCSCSVSSSK